MCPMFLNRDHFSKFFHPNIITDLRDPQNECTFFVKMTPKNWFKAQAAHAVQSKSEYPPSVAFKRYSSI